MTIYFRTKKYRVRKINTVIIMSDDPLVDKFITKGFNVQKRKTRDFSSSDLKKVLISIPEMMSKIMKIIFPK